VIGATSAYWTHYGTTEDVCTTPALRLYCFEK
jgi:hypothetical protein